MVLKIGIVFGLLLIVGNVAAEEVQLGPYLVSFDMEDVGYDIELLDPVEKETYGGTEYLQHNFFISTDDAIIAVLFQECPVPLTYTFGDLWKLFDVDSAHMRDIDGHHSALLIENEWYGDPKYHIAYALEDAEWIDDDGGFTADRYDDKNAILCSRDLVAISSTSDWDTTRQFLTTIHVEKIE